MTSQAEWRRIAYERSVGEKGNNSIGSVYCQQGYQTYLKAQQERQRNIDFVSRINATTGCMPSFRTEESLSSATNNQWGINDRVPFVRLASIGAVLGFLLGYANVFDSIASTFDPLAANVIGAVSISILLPLSVALLVFIARLLLFLLKMALMIGIVCGVGIILFQTLS